MRKKLVLFSLVLVLLTVGIMFGSVVYITNMVLPSGSAEEFAALRGYDDSVLYQEEGKRRYGGSAYEAGEYLKTLFADTSLRHLIGGVQWVEESMNDHVLCYITEPSQELCEQLQQNPACEYMKVVLAKCDYSLLELAEAEKKFEAFLASAPNSLQNSVQFYMVMPRQNRVAVYVKHWSIADQLRLASALGQDCAKFYLVEGDLMQTTKNITTGQEQEWMARDQALREQLNTEEPKGRLNPLINAAAVRLSAYQRDLWNTAKLIYPEDDWRVLLLNGVWEFAPYHESGDMQVTAYAYRSLSGMQSGEYTIYFYKEWERKHEYMIRAVFSSMERDLGVYVVYGMGRTIMS